MPTPCHACVHPRRADINAAILSAPESGATNEQIGQRFGLSRGVISRHRLNHLTISPQAVTERSNVLTIVGYANDLYARACAVLARAESILTAEGTSTRGITAASQALRETRASIELLAKLVTDAEAPAETDANAALDRQIGAALDALVMPALPSGDPAIADAVVIPE